MSNLPSLSVIVPVRDGGAAFQRCLAALAAARRPDHELIVVDDGSRDESRAWAAAAGARVLTTPRPGSGPAAARNLGAAQAAGALLFFCDADVEIRPETLTHVVTALAADPGLAALFGSYDDAPGDPGFISQYKNLMHHYVHQHAREQASTFWSGCGAIRRAAFVRCGGFSARYGFPSIEDIELGVRLTSAGERVRLDKTLQVKHLKRWTLAGLLRSDILARGVPWTRLILRQGRAPNDLPQPGQPLERGAGGRRPAGAGPQRAVAGGRGRRRPRRAALALAQSGGLSLLRGQARAGLYAGRHRPALAVLPLQQPGAGPRPGAASP